MTPLHLPPYSPQLNPVERLWQHLKRLVLDNTVFDSIEHLEDRFCEVWQTLTPESLRSLCHASWCDDIL